MKAFVSVFVVLVLCGCAAAIKECTNIPTQSHTFTHQLLSSKNETWKEEVMSHYHLTPTDESAWADMLPRKFLSERQQHDWAVMYKKIKNMGVFESPQGFLKEVPLEDVRLHENSIHGTAQRTNLEYLLMFDVDRLIWSFRKTAGLPTPGTPYGGWEEPKEELRGHFVGHYLSASSLMWASTQNDELKQKMTSLVAGLSACQEKIGTGYLSAFPSELFDRFEAIQIVWAPYYTIHKIMAGLLDQYTFAGNSQALKMVIRMVDYFYNRVQNVITKYTINRHYQSLNTETGGMNDVLYRLYSITANDIADLHANTHIPIVVGSQRRYEITGDPLHKVSRHLFRWTKEVSYADYYERALTNGVLSIQRGTDPGVMIYMLPLGPGVSKAHTYHSWGTPFDTFWCCYGTGIESFSKLGDSIYFEEEGGNSTLYIIQYISSSFNWKSGKILLNQTVVPAASWDPYLRVTFTFSPSEKTWTTLNFRVPTWTSLDGAKGILNGETLSLPTPANFLSITRQWNANDNLTLLFPQTPRTEAIKDDRPEFASTQAILYGPYLLAGHTLGGDWHLKSGADWITPVPASYNSQLVSFSQYFKNSTFVLANSNQTLGMQKFPKSGTDMAVQATFRLVPKESSSKFSTLADANDRSVMLEPFDLPGMNVVHQGADKPLVIEDSSKGTSSSVFVVVPGLDGRNGSISLESQSDKGCYVYSDLSSSAGVKLSCKSDSDAKFNEATSFISQKGLSQYNPISFVAKGVNRNFLLEPLFSFRDEYYTVYFNIVG
ncbi:hypothetical protein LR48_Vigan08g160900 [Vigna angularis]|uniref:Alpha-L-arabinofuranosidase B arabinose-binding domain-containing protein n=1 Tax=Phaseolus angularis TaxID=3914 RepID=A0A0L9V772_PHAAN|nr:hypothetical protein LR48_Vigan08g160900 [Vigna angularis]